MANINEKTAIPEKNTSAEKVAVGEKKQAEYRTRASGSALPNDVGVGVIRARDLDYSDLKPVWDRLIDKRRSDSENNLLRITVRTNKLDPIADVALALVKTAYTVDENALRQLITRKGWATELDRVNKRINSLRISENKRIVLAIVYPSLLKKLLDRDSATQAVKDDIGFSNDIIFELERENGPLDLFAQEVVKLVGAKHRINFTDDNVMRDLVAHQVRAGL